MPDLPSNARRQHAIDWLDARADSVQQSIVRWCYQNSWSSDLDGLVAMADLLEHDFAVLGLPCQRIELADWQSVGDDGNVTDHQTGPALLWHYHKGAARRVLLLIHYDTVYPPAQRPLSISMTGTGQLIGPGVADAKGGIAVILYAVQALLRFDLAGDLGISIMLNPDEEIGSPSSATLLRDLASEVDLALVFEPTLPDGSMVANRKGTANFTIVIRGRPAHAGRDPDQGRNAIVHAARLATELDAWNQPGSRTTVNVGKISGGGPLNQVPDLAILGVNIRVATNAAVGDVMARLSEIEQRYSAAQGFTCRIHGRFHSPPKCVDDDPRFDDLRRRVDAAAAHLGRVLQWRDTGGACDGNKLAAFGCPTVDTMGPTGGQLHSPAEYCDLATVVTAAKVLVHLIAEIGNGS